MEFLMRTRISLSITVALICSIGLISCGRLYRADREKKSWASYACSRGSAAQLGAVDSALPGGHFKLLWQKSVSGKPAGPLSIHNGALVYPETRKKIRFYDVQTGHELGRWKAKGVPQTGVLISDSIAIFGVSPRRDFLRAVQAFSAKRLWQKKVKDVAAGPIIVDNRLIVSSGDGLVRALELDDGESAWTFTGDQRPSAAASCGHERIFQPAEHGWLYVLSPDSGRELYRVQLDGSLVSPVAVAQFVYATTVTGRVYALNPDDGSTIWKADVGNPVWTSPAVGRDRVFVGHSGGEVLAFDAVSGHELWRYQAGGVIRASVLSVGDLVIVGTMTGRLLALKADDGSLVDSTTVKGAVLFSPVSDGKRLFVATQAGKILCFGDRDEQADLTRQGINAQLQPQ
jgi:outer membrane protein assembly factor BamB